MVQSDGILNEALTNSRPEALVPQGVTCETKHVILQAQTLSEPFNDRVLGFRHSVCGWRCDFRGMVRVSVELLILVLLVFHRKCVKDSIELTFRVPHPGSVRNPQNPPPSSFQDGLAFNVLDPQAAVLVDVVQLAVAFHGDTSPALLTDQVDAEPASRVLVRDANIPSAQALCDLCFEVGVDSVMPSR